MFQHSWTLLSNKMIFKKIFSLRLNVLKSCFFLTLFLFPFLVLHLKLSFPLQETL